jgi:hypothetical protein
MIRLGAPRISSRLLAALLLAGCGTLAASGDEAIELPGWQQIAWPFPRDAWEPGLAFVCISEECRDSTIYVRPKIGFCNCATGVSDDEEIDRVTDLDLIDPAFKPRGDGRMIEAAGMRGRARHYVVSSRGALRETVAIALARKCDVIVAVAQSSSSHRFTEEIALSLVAAPPIRHWVEVALDNSR